MRIGSEYIPINIPAIRGGNGSWLPVNILAIQDKTYKHRIFNSMAQTSKALSVDIRSISDISSKRKYGCASGWTFIKMTDNTDIKREKSEFKIFRETAANKDFIPDTRTCGKCKIEKKLCIDNFHRGKSKRTKYKKQTFHSICKECRKGTHKLNYQTQLKKTESSPENKAAYLLKIYKRIDKYKGIECDLSVEWILYNIIGKKCVYCGFTDKIGIERIDNSIGHIISNCAPCCKVCNITRMDNFTHDEFLKIGSVIAEIKKKRGL